MDKKLKYREVAAGIGIATSSYGNVESSPWRVIGEERAKAIADYYVLDPERRAALLKAWAETPISNFSVDRAEKWRIQNARRSAAKQLPVVNSALVGLIAFAIQFTPESQLCACGFDGKVPGSDRSCELCEALKALGLPTFSTREKVVDDLGKYHAKLEARAGKS